MGHKDRGDPRVKPNPKQRGAAPKRNERQLQNEEDAKERARLRKEKQSQQQLKESKDKEDAEEKAYPCEGDQQYQRWRNDGSRHTSDDDPHPGSPTSPHSVSDWVDSDY